MAFIDSINLPQIVLARPLATSKLDDYLSQLYDEAVCLGIQHEYQSSLEVLTQFIHSYGKDFDNLGAIINYDPEDMDSILIEIPSKTISLNLYFGDDNMAEQYYAAMLLYKADGRYHITNNTIKNIAEIVKRIVNNEAIP